ncbi:MORN motif-containing protein [Artemisia annua]|uniref:MORN motif-containing protein n=1 Tax=Artemisia annua TaxID=35608 RepID=A0A2U1LDZ3_ARTAN|nr:MORN motif-containing protein [Artemisia annua]
MYAFRYRETQSGPWWNGVLDVPNSQSAMYPVLHVVVYRSKALNSIGYNPNGYHNDDDGSDMEAGHAGGKTQKRLTVTETHANENQCIPAIIMELQDQFNGYDPNLGYNGSYDFHEGDIPNSCTIINYQ